MGWVPQGGRQWAWRLSVAALILAGGVALCLVLDHHWHVKLVPESHAYFESVTGDLMFVGAPFYVLAVVAVLGVRVLIAGCGFAVLGAMTYAEYKAYGTSTSSTSALVFLWSWFVGVPIGVATVIPESILRERRLRRDT